MMLWAIIAYRSIQLSMIVELLLIEAEFLAELISFNSWGFRLLTYLPEVAPEVCIIQFKLEHNQDGIKFRALNNRVVLDL